MNFNYITEYAQKLTFADEAVKLVSSGNTIRYAFEACSDNELDIALARRKGELQGISIYADDDHWHNYHVKQVDSTVSHFYFVDNNIKQYERSPIFKQNLAVDIACKKNASFIPGFIFMAVVSPMDQNGFFWLAKGIPRNKYRAEIKSAQYIFVEINENIYVTDERNREFIHLSEIHYVVPSFNAPLLNMESHYLFRSQPGY